MSGHPQEEANVATAWGVYRRCSRRVRVTPLAGFGTRIGEPGSCGLCDVTLLVSSLLEVVA